MRKPAASVALGMLLVGGASGAAIAAPRAQILYHEAIRPQVEQVAGHTRSMSFAAYGRQFNFQLTANPAVQRAVPADRTDIEALRGRLDAVHLHAPDFHVPERVRRHVDLLHQAIAERRRLDFGYVDAEGAASRRRVRPLGLFFWGGAWTLAAWCESRADFRAFRLDRIEKATPGTGFEPEPGRTLQDYMARACD